MNNFEMIKALTLPEMAEFLDKTLNISIKKILSEVFVDDVITQLSDKSLDKVFFRQWLESESEEE